MSEPNVITTLDPTLPTLTPITLSLSTPAGERELRFEFDLGSGVQSDMYNTLTSGTFYEAETTMLLLTVLRPGDRFVDVGGHIGYFSVVASTVVGPDGEVITFEPAPSNYARLLGHLALNGCANVLPLHVAVGDADQRTTLHLNSDNDGGHALWDVRSHPLNARSRANPRAHDVWMTRIARVVGDRPVRAMKLDIEGAELGALRGARSLLEGPDGVPFVIAEVNASALAALGGSDTELRAFMDALGYDTWMMQLAEPQLMRLEPDVQVESAYVYNVLFWKRGVAL